ncbi:Calpain-B [Chionoecetes opilio]|uniref:Calpain-B n=1 Tax=Chionoecetes opilio TaxID=41210 RepID=A0A8J4YEY1_CHIOP|nr:Calpain-B [Chionoecetes opilio]
MVGSIGARKLNHALNTLFAGEVEFCLDMTRSLLAMVDKDLSGTVDYYEFEALVFSLQRWVDVYNRKRDQETRTLSGYDWQLGDALRELGYQVPRRLQGLVVVRYGDDQGNISLQDFLMATCRISVMLERFRDRSGMEGEQATLLLNDWLQDTLYC